jgi:hypothetical protein
VDFSLALTNLDLGSPEVSLSGFLYARPLSGALLDWLHGAVLQALAGPVWSDQQERQGRNAFDREPASEENP